VKDYDVDKSIFRNEEYHDYFVTYFEETCGGKRECVFNPSKM